MTAAETAAEPAQAAAQALAIDARGLAKSFGALEAVTDFTLTVERGESFALVGPDGAGKTTTLRMLCGVMDPDAGQARVLGLVCALVHTPELLILDEPTCGVDPVSRREFWHILHGLLGTGLTIVLSTAYLDEAERAGRVGLMHRGRLLAVDKPEAVRAGFAGELVEVRAEDLATARRLLAGHALARRSLVVGDRLMVTVDDAGRAMPELEAALAGAGLEGLSLERAQPTLEDRFVQMIDQGRA